MKEIYQKIFKNATSIVLSVIACALLLGGFAWAATTISANIVTEGTLSVTGLATFDHATSTSATTTDYLYIGPDGSEDYFDFQGGDLYVRNDAEIDGALYLGGSITLQNGETIANSTDTNIAFGTVAMSMATTTATTTGSVWVSAPAGTATSTVIIGGGEDGDATANSGCIELWKENKPYKVYIDTTGAALKVAAGRCKD